MSNGMTPARANAPLPLVATTVATYVSSFGIAPEKLVLGVPWYGEYT